MEEILDVLRGRGWSPTGPDYDPVRFLKNKLDRSDLQDEIFSLKRQVESLREDKDELESKVCKLTDTVELLTRDLEDAKQKLAAAQEAAA